MAKEVVATIKLQIPAGQANPAPPVFYVYYQGTASGDPFEKSSQYRSRFKRAEQDKGWQTDQERGHGYREGEDEGYERELRRSGIPHAGRHRATDGNRRSRMMVGTRSRASD